MKSCPLVDHLSLYDVVNTPGVTADLSHISSVAKIDGYLPADDGMKKAFTDADMVVIPAGIPRKSSTQFSAKRSPRATESTC
jgi:malate dehydrogenase